MDIELAWNGPAATITLNRPAKRNAMTLDMWRRVPVLVEQALARDTTRLLLLRGSGGSFCAGADIAEFPAAYASAEAAIANQRSIQAAMAAVEQCPLPTLAAIEGPCYGGGCGLSLACDLRFAADSATFAITPAKLGLVYGIDDTRRLAAAVGPSRAKDILFTGRTMTAAEAMQMGLVNAVHPAGELDQAIARLAANLASVSLHSARATKKILARLADGCNHDDDESRAMFAGAFEGPDFREGFAAFMERRPPKFS